ncbi:hypothetical protein SAMN02744124_00337 [Paenibacillus barengoltzii J12]|jgi:hypothetical protein|uniref:Uncharacterized protein n=1 Tax=Paenibacillus barengoltzii J12 TaxID=935846 RepID=A0ABY1LSB1_9BACL|nr:hypothetical protein SAMN02744124_00337 [Paenibacillus barengoltzii J12]
MVFIYLELLNRSGMPGGFFAGYAQGGVRV